MSKKTGTKKKQTKQKEKQQGFNDLLIPMLLILCIMPFIVRLALYSCGYAKYPWYSDDDVIMDLYSYYRCYFFEVVAIFTAAVLAFRIGLFPENRKKMKIFIPLAVYAGMILLSTLLSVNMGASFTGNFYQFQGVLVLLGYLVFCLYAYQVMEQEKDYKTIWYGIVAVFIVMAVLGIFQIAKKDLLDFAWMQRLVMSKEQFAEYGGTLETIFSGNNVFLSLYNPNYAGVFLTMFAPVFAVMCSSEKEKKKKIFYGILCAGCLILIWFTYSRSTFFALLVALVVGCVLSKQKIGKLMKYILPEILILAVVFVGIDKINDFHYLSRWKEDTSKTKLESMVTSKDGVELCYDGKEYLITLEDKKAKIYDKKGRETDIKKVDKSAKMAIAEYDEEKYIDVYLCNQTFTFGKNSKGYYYRTENGKETQLTDIPKVDAGGKEYLGSGRIYIWSRTLPILKKYIVAGSGPDTFAEVFPQNDYVGKAIYANNPARVIEKPHNDYLMQWVQNGFLALVAMIAFYVLLLKKCGTFYYKRELSDIKTRLGLGCYLGCICYMAGSLFNDSTLYTTPVFWIFAGIALASAYEVEK